MGRPRNMETRRVPVPEGAIVYSNGRVLDKGRNFNLPRDFVIGHMDTGNLMIPNENYFTFHMREYRIYDPEGAALTLPAELKAGLYLLVLTAAQRLGIYASLLQKFGLEQANAIMDYVMFLLKDRSNSTMLLSSVLRGEVTFTSAPYDESWYSKFFARDKDDMKIHLVLEDWLKTCAGNGLSEVYLVLDGSNNNCASKKNIYATPGAAKSGKKVRVSGFLWAVCASGDLTGMPLTYHLNKGGLVDARSVRKAVSKLKANNICVKGIICDRGFCVQELLELLHEVNLPYIIMLQSSLGGAQTMRSMYGDRLREWVYEDYTGNGEFGVIDKVKLFDKAALETNVVLLYNPAKAVTYGMKLLENASKTVQRIQTNIQKGHRAAVPKGLSKYIQIEGQGKDRKVIVDVAKLTEDYKSGGFAAIAVYENMSAKDAQEIYDLRQPSERPFSIFKSQLGCDVLRVHKTTSTRKKFFVCFLATIIRYEIQSLCKKLGLATNPIIKDMSEIHYSYENQQYVYADSCFFPQEQLLSGSGVELKDLKLFSGEITRRYIGCLGEPNKVRSIFNTFPWTPNALHSVIPCQMGGVSEPIAGLVALGDSSEQAQQEKTEPMSLVNESDNTIQEKQKRKRRPGGGRKKGSKNKKTLEREAEEQRLREAGEYVEPIKRPRGRPKGSKDKKKRAPRSVRG